MSPVRRALSAAATAGMLATILSPAAARAPGDAPASAPCEAPRYVTAIGWTCPAPGGYLVIMGDGSVGFTHGGDPVPGHTRRHIDVAPAAPTCVRDTSSLFHIQLMYVHPSDQGSRYAEMVGEIRRMVRQANGLVVWEAERRDRMRSLRTACAGSQPSVIELQLPSINERQDFAQVLTEVRRAGYASPLAKYWIYYDGRPPDAPGGTALAYSDQQLSATNQNNYGPGYAVTWGITEAQGGAGVMLHELAHTLGAVQHGAPNATGGFHCNDGIDVMCYDDGDSRANYDPSVCARVRFDCRNDDYFHPSPGSNNYLASNWNLGSPLNRFLQACVYRAGTLVADAEDIAGGLLQGATYLAISDKVGIPKRCRGSRFALSATTPPAPEVVYAAVGVVPYPVTNPQNRNSFIGFGPEHRFADLGPQRPDVNVCFYDGNERIRCFDDPGTVTRRVPNRATAAQVTLDGGVAGLWVLSVE